MSWGFVAFNWVLVKFILGKPFSLGFIHNIKPLIKKRVSRNLVLLSDKFGK